MFPINIQPAKRYEQKIVNNIKRKTFNLNMRVLSIYVDLGDNVNLESKDNIDCVYITNEEDIKKYDVFKTNKITKNPIFNDFLFVNLLS